MSVLFGCINSYLHDVTYALSRLAVPYFIILFCYFLERKLIKDNHTIVYVSRLCTLLIPFCFWSLLYFIITADLSSVALNPTKIITMYWSGYGWSGQYFFVLLFQVIFLFPIFRLLAKYKTIRLLILSITGFLCIWNTYFYHFIPTIITKISDRLIIYWVPYILLGILMARFPQRACKSKWLFLTVILIPFEYMLNAMVDDSGSPYLRISVLVVAYITLPALMFISGEIKGKLGSVISFFGVHSMALFVLNPLIILILEKTEIFQLSFESQGLDYILSIVISFSVAFLAYFSSLFLRGSFFRSLV